MGLNFAEIAEDVPVENTGNSDNFLDNFVMMPKAEGVVVARILPPANSDLPMMFGGLCMCTRIHTINKNDQNPNGRRIHCPRERAKNSRTGKTYFAGDCKICEHYNWLYEESKALKAKGNDAGAAALVRQAKEIKPVERYYFNVIIREETKDGKVQYNVGPKILSMGKSLWERVREAILGNPKMRKTPLGDITHPLTGRDLIIRKEITTDGNETFPNYDKSDFDQVSPLGEPEQVKAWMAGLHDLQSLRIIKSADEINAELREFLGAPSVRRRSTYNPDSFLKESQVAVESNRVVEDAPVVQVPVFDEFSHGHTQEAEVPNIAMDGEDFYKNLEAAMKAS